MTKPKKHYQFILFDWDGTLAKTLDVTLEAARSVLAKRGLDLTDREISATFGTFKSDWPSLGVTDVDTAFDETLALVRAELPGVELYPNVVDTLEYLHQYGLQLAVITSSPRIAFEELVHTHNLSGTFDFVVASEDVERQKPDPEAALIAMAGLNADKTRSILVGDSSKDLGCANNAHIDSVLFHSTEHAKFHSDTELIAKYHPTYVIKEFHELKDLLVANPWTSTIPQADKI
jgi:pyrophosphatase PpaX